MNIHLFNFFLKDFRASLSFWITNNISLNFNRIIKSHWENTFINIIILFINLRSYTTSISSINLKSMYLLIIINFFLFTKYFIYFNKRQIVYYNMWIFVIHDFHYISFSLFIKDNLNLKINNPVNILFWFYHPCAITLKIFYSHVYLCKI